MTGHFDRLLLAFKTIVTLQLSGEKKFLTKRRHPENWSSKRCSISFEFARVTNKKRDSLSKQSAGVYATYQFNDSTRIVAAKKIIVITAHKPEIIPQILLCLKSPSVM